MVFIFALNQQDSIKRDSSFGGTRRNAATPQFNNVWRVEIAPPNGLETYG
jgi:hypothetical protein